MCFDQPIKIIGQVWARGLGQGCATDPPSNAWHWRAGKRFTQPNHYFALNVLKT